MKPGHIAILIATVTAFLATFIISNGLSTGFVTGLAAADAINLQPGKAHTTETTAELQWSTNRKAMSTLEINGEQTAFSAAKEFRKELHGLTPGKTYFYRIRACTDKVCEQQSSSFTAGTGSTGLPATGLVAGIGDLAGTFRTTVNYLPFALLAFLAAAITVRAGYDKFSQPNIGAMLKKAKKHINEEEYDEASMLYANARKAFAQLEHKAQLSHYNDLAEVYQSLRRQADIKQAQELTEKYSSGTITGDELMKLNELMFKES
ncbi:fibronectin type III domain-containing protein [Candidatus Woesearchaeota archaeon]|nr:fibronectin type III domain-containing protein [Candidatus Woesearchaeota archaeon]